MTSLLLYLCAVVFLCAAVVWAAYCISQLHRKDI